MLNFGDVLLQLRNLGGGRPMFKLNTSPETF